jgi:hypothetical protein
MTPEQVAKSFEQLTRSGVGIAEWNDWYRALAQPEPQQGGPQRVSERAYQEMDAIEKYAYARQFSRG